MRKNDIRRLMRQIEAAKARPKPKPKVIDWSWLDSEPSETDKKPRWKR